MDLDTDTRLVRRARIFGHVTLSRARGPWQWGGNLRFSGDRADRLSGEPRTLHGYGVLDLTAAYTISTRLKVFGRIENVFDREYQTAFGYQQAGRGAFVGLTWQPAP